jgi:hypothetical protein
MKKIGLLILSLVAVTGGLLLIFRNKLFGTVSGQSNELKTASTGSTTASTSTSPSIVYVTQNVSGNATIGSVRVTNSGSISSGKIFFKIQNTGEATGTVNVGTGVRTLKPDEFIVYNESLNPSVKPSGSITYDATGTEFIIDTVDA